MNNSDNNNTSSTGNNGNNSDATTDPGDIRPTSNAYTDPAAAQLGEFAKAHQYDPPKTRTTVNGAPIGDGLNTYTIGPRGPILEDHVFIESMSHANRERVPERLVHAKGAGAFGYFEVTSPEITKYCKADLFKKVGQRTEALVRFSTIFGERGSADTVRDGRGFAIKLYTNEGNLDLVLTNSPVFFIRSVDSSARWDLYSAHPESFHMITFLYSDYGIPLSFRHIQGFGENTFKMINANGEAFFNKYYLKPDQGVINMDPTTAAKIAGEDPDYGNHDLYNAIERKAYPSWTFYIQIMTLEQAKGYEFNPFDLTKVWPLAQFPLIEVGRLTLNRNLDNFFVQNEQICFSPSTLVPGIELSPDKTLQARSFAYSDTQRNRVGPNFEQMIANQPKTPTYYPRIRDGPMVTGDNFGSAPNYYPNSFDTNVITTPQTLETREQLIDTSSYRYRTEQEDNYTQVRDLYLSYDEDKRKRLSQNIATDLGNAYDFIQKRTLGHLKQIHPEYAEYVRAAIEAMNTNKK